MPNASKRGLLREGLNSDFMKMKGYDVIDNPKVESTDEDEGIKPNKNPDHRINGKIYDSYSPKVTITDDWDERVENQITRNQLRYPEYEIPASGFSNMDFLSHHGENVTKSWMQILRESIKKHIWAKVKSGQARNILLNVSDIYGGEQLLQDSLLADMFERVTNLKSVVCIYPKRGREWRGLTEGEGTEWENHLPCDMEAAEWLKGVRGFSPLKDLTGGSGTPTDNGPSGSQPAGGGPAGGGPAGLPPAGSGPAGGGPAGGFSWLGRWMGSLLGILAGIGSILGPLLPWLGIAAAAGAFVGFLYWLLSSKDSQPTREPTTKSSKAAVKMYKAQMRQVLYGNGLIRLNKCHLDMKVVAHKLIPASMPDNEDVTTTELDQILEDEYQRLLVERQVCTVIDVQYFIKPLFVACQLFIFLVSRSVDTLVTIATKKAMLQYRVLGTHLGLLALSVIGRHLFHFAFLGFLSGPLKLLQGACVVSMVIWLLYECTGRCARVASEMKHISLTLWEHTEHVHAETIEMPERAAVTMASICILQVLIRCSKSIGIVSTILNMPSRVFAPIKVVVTMFGYMQVLAKVGSAMSFCLLVLLVILALAMIFPHSSVAQQIHLFTNIQYKGKGVNSFLDTLWEKAELFIRSKPHDDLD